MKETELKQSDKIEITKQAIQIIHINKMKTIIIILASILLFSCASVEDRLKDYSYTDYWKQYQGQRYQVYKTKFDKYYIVVVNKSETRLIRKYIKLDK